MRSQGHASPGRRCNRSFGVGRYRSLITYPPILSDMFQVRSKALELIASSLWQMRKSASKYLRDLKETAHQVSL